MKLAIGSDHAGFFLKEELRKKLEEMGHELIDCGTFSQESCDYPTFGRAVGEAVAQKKAERGIAICGSGIGISIAANKVGSIRAALCSEPLSAELSRRHNDANVICMGARMIGSEMALRIVEVFLNTEFEGQRHARRVEAIE